MAWLAAAILCGCASPSREKSAKHVTIGAIRWDAWFSDAVNPWEKNLGDKKWHGRLPFYAKIIADDHVEVHGDTQAAVDQEIAYAKAGGIDYWAFLYYQDYDVMNRARRLYLSSQHKRDVNFCLIVYPKRGEDPRNPDKDSNEWVALMQEPSYQKVAGGRPLLYFMFWETNSSVPQVFGSVEQGRAYMDKLRRRIMQAGQKNPYFVALSQEPEIGAAAAAAAGLDAISAYTSWGGPDYAGLCAGAVRNWNGMKATGKKIVPNLVAGWGGPRDGLGDKLQPQPAELAAHVRSAFDWIDANPTVAEARTTLFYAWNEMDEGGWLVPDKGQGTAKLDAIRRVVDERRKVAPPKAK
jgi:hypothetical protein